MDSRTSRILGRLSRLLLPGLALFLSACATTDGGGQDPAVADSSGVPESAIRSSVVAEDGVPRHFVLELSIVRGRLAPAATGLPDRNGRWVLFPDGALHYEERGDRGADWLPGKTRTLTRPQMARLWDELEVDGFADPDAGAPPVNFALLEPAEDGLLYACAITADDRRWAFVERFPADGVPPRFARLARLLGALAWVADGPPRSTRIIPKRYDFGPDPYAPYRQP